MLVTISLLREVLAERPELAADWVIPDLPGKQWIDVRTIPRADGTPERPFGGRPTGPQELRLRVALRKANARAFRAGISGQRLRDESPEPEMPLTTREAIGASPVASG